MKSFLLENNSKQHWNHEENNEIEIETNTKRSDHFWASKSLATLSKSEEKYLSQHSKQSKRYGKLVLKSKHPQKSNENLRMSNENLKLNDAFVPKAVSIKRKMAYLTDEEKIKDNNDALSKGIACIITDALWNRNKIVINFIIPLHCISLKY